MNLVPWGKVGKVISAGVKALSAVASMSKVIAKAQGMLRRVADATADLAQSALDRMKKLGRSGCNSFVAGTRVLMADGSSKPIEQVHNEDKVKATDPVSGLTLDREVRRTIVHSDEGDMTRLSVAGGTVESTSWHRVWVEERRDFVAIGTIKPGEHLRSPDGTQQVVRNVQRFAQVQSVYDLTIEGIQTHTYYVVVNDASVLVHNCEDKVWEPFHPGVDDSYQGPLPDSAGISPGASLEEGSYHFVVRQDGSLRAMEDNSMWAIDASAGTRPSGDRKGVLMAGTFDVNARGSISRVDNFSGHCRPVESSGFTPLLEITRGAFRRHGWGFSSKAWDYFSG